MATYKKGDQETLDFGIDWSDWCTKEGVTLDSSTWIVPIGLTNVTDVYNTVSTTIFISGGTINEMYKLVNEVTAIKAAGTVTAERSIYVLIVEDKFK